MSFISYLINGISLGSVYAIIALGYTMVYGIAKMLNFAHGDVIMIGAYVVMAAVTGAGLPPIAAILAAIIFCTVLGVLIETVAYGPLLNAASSLAVLITAIGVSYLLQNCAFDFRSEYHIFPKGSFDSGNCACRRQPYDYRRGHCHHCFLHCDYDGIDVVYQKIQIGPGNAGCFRGQRRGAAYGN